jgi:hypothetical protein
VVAVLVMTRAIPRLSHQAVLEEVALEHQARQSSSELQERSALVAVAAGAIWQQVHYSRLATEETEEAGSLSFDSWAQPHQAQA